MRTPSNRSIPEPWFSFPCELDSAVETEVRLDCMGGFIVTMVYGFSRPTGDLDVLEISPRDAGKPLLEPGKHGGPLHRKYKIYLDPVGVAHVPENYEDRLTEIFPKSFQHLRLCALDSYDLALSKLERNIQRDRDDVKYLARTVPFDLQVLKERYQKETALAARQPRARGPYTQTLDLGRRGRKKAISTLLTLANLPCRVPSLAFWCSFYVRKLRGGSQSHLIRASRRGTCLTSAGRWDVLLLCAHSERHHQCENTGSSQTSVAHMDCFNLCRRHRGPECHHLAANCP